MKFEIEVKDFLFDYAPNYLLIDTSKITKEEYLKLNLKGFKEDFLFHKKKKKKIFNNYQDFNDKIFRMINEFKNIEKKIFNFNFEKIYKKDDLDKIKFVYQYLLYRLKKNNKEIQFFQEVIEEYENNIVLEQFYLIKNGDKYEKGPIRIFHLLEKCIEYKDDGSQNNDSLKFCLHPLFIDTNHVICCNSNNKTNNKLLNEKLFYDFCKLKIKK